VPNDYIELPISKKARYIRFTNYHVPTPYLAISDLRIFGFGQGEKPQRPDNFAGKRRIDRRVVDLNWSPVKNAQGYVVYFGIAPDKLYNSIMIYKDTILQLNSLNIKPEYFFEIEAFNENGVSERTSLIKPD
jgi:hypothetical protein